MTTQQDELVLKDEDQILAYTHQKREEIVGALTKDGVPNDRADVSLLLTTLKDMDGAALSRKRIKSEEKQIDTATQVAASLSRILTNSNIKNAFTIENAIERETPTLGTEVPEPQLVPGETDIGVSNQTYDTFMQDYKEKHFKD